MIDAANPNELARQMIDMARRISNLVDAEIAAMKANRLDGANADAQEKERLVHSWRLEVERVRAHPDLLSGADRTAKEELAKISGELAEKLETHAASLAARRSVTEGLVQSIAAEVARVRKAPDGYGASGSARSGGPARAGGVAVDAKA